ncbi:hypothetical protein LGQ03_07305 [Loktanella sp. TSTF-M6]|uniref:Uncharacterized protein n=1 Tax=Loktanella gaetbuli TaxID=2881335 RepID=A0ABS8BTJ5_9RHOB|nr:hypothetical protein [Loktanella gaetbuli]MCB5199043.1 hypothetical protein [Loktanella gaetbuli]
MLRPVRLLMCRLGAAIARAERETYDIQKQGDDHIRRIARQEAMAVWREKASEKRQQGAAHD